MKSNERIAGYVITKNVNGKKSYLAWQNPAWDESGYFWTSYEGLVKSLMYGYNTMHSFVFTSNKECNDMIRRFVKKYECLDNINTEMIQLEYIHDDERYNIAGMAIEICF